MYQEEYLSDLLEKAKESCKVLKFDNWAMKQMFLLFERQIKILETIKDIIESIKSSDLYKRENNLLENKEREKDIKNIQKVLSIVPMSYILEHINNIPLIYYSYMHDVIENLEYVIDNILVDIYDVSIGKGLNNLYYYLDQSISLDYIDIDKNLFRMKNNKNENILNENRKKLNNEFQKIRIYIKKNYIEIDWIKCDEIARKNFLKERKESSLFEKNIEIKVNKGEIMEKLDFFISHSESDSDLAGSLVELLREALNIEKKRIRCTSVPGYELEYGRSIVELIKEDLVSSKIVIALLTENALKSTWVMFELGGAWFADSFIVPILSSELSVKDLPGPLNTSAILGSKKKDDIENRINGLLNQLAKDFNFERDSDGAASSKIKKFIKELQIDRLEDKKSINDDIPILDVKWLDVVEDEDGKYQYGDELEFLEVEAVKSYDEIIQEFSIYKLNNEFFENIEDIIDNNLEKGKELERESLKKLKTSTNTESRDITSIKYGKALSQFEANRQDYPNLKSELADFLVYINNLINNYDEDIGSYESDKRAFSPSFRVFNNGSVPAENLKVRIKHNSKVKYYYKNEIPSNGIEIYDDLKDLATSFMNTLNNKSNSSMISFWNKYRRYYNKYTTMIMPDMDSFRSMDRLQKLEYARKYPPKYEFLIEDNNLSLDYNELLTHEMNRKFINMKEVFFIANIEKGEEVIVEYKIHADNLKESKKGTLIIKGK